METRFRELLYDCHQRYMSRVAESVILTNGIRQLQLFDVKEGNCSLKGELKMADEQVLPSLIETAEKHRRIRTQGLDADMNWLASQPSELVLWSDGLRQIVSVRGDIYKEECTDILVLLTLLNKHDFLQHKCNTVFRFIKERCEHESGPETFFRRKDD